jgi:type I restriction enzyme M protein
MTDWISLFAQCAATPGAERSPLPTLATGNPPFGEVRTARCETATEFECAYQWKKLADTPRTNQTATTDRYERSDRLMAKVNQCAMFIELNLKHLQEGEVLCLLVENGILSNTQTAYFRWWLIERITQIVASIQMPATAFQVECKLSLISSIFIVKRLSDANPKRYPEDYSIFMAVSENCGFNSRGKRIYKHDEKGYPIKPQQLNSDLPEILDAFLDYKIEQRIQSLKEAISIFIEKHKITLDET